jgi:surface protein
MDYMFFEATAFNQDIAGWCVTNIVSEPSEFSAESPLSESNKPVWGTCPKTLTPITDANIQTAVDLWVSDPSVATTIYGAISDWDVSQVTDMSELFKDKTTFNDDISNWDVSNVTNMYAMFYNAQSFNQDIGAWNVSSVTNMTNMFLEATSFNQDIGAWDVSSVTISIYPNPTNNTLFISGNETPIAVSIYNVLGKEVLSIKKTNNINVQALPSGVYVIRISDGVRQTNRKFIKN